MNNPELWGQIKGLLKGTPEWQRVMGMKEYSNLKDEDRLAGEVLAHISGKKNAGRMEAEAKRMIDGAKTFEDAAKAASLLGRMRDALKKFWTWVGKTLLGKKGNINIDQVSNMVLADLVNSVDPFNPNRGKRRVRKSTDVSLESEIGRINSAFNARIKELDSDRTQKDRVLRLGRPGGFLRAAGIQDADIEMEFDRFVKKSSEDYKNDHPFTADDIMDLPIAINNPIAVFESSNGMDKVILTELKKRRTEFYRGDKGCKKKQKWRRSFGDKRNIYIVPKAIQGPHQLDIGRERSQL